MAMSLDDTESNNDTWPKDGNERIVIEELNSLRSRLDGNLARKLCNGWPFNSFYQARTIYSQEVMGVYLQLLNDIFLRVERMQFFQMFPKGCGGCVIYELYAIVALHPSLHIQVHNLLKLLLNDHQERLLSLIPNEINMAKAIQKDYKRNDHAFPHNGVCLDLAKSNREGKIVGALGAMITSKEFLVLLKKHKQKAVNIAGIMFNGRREISDFDYELYSLLPSEK